MRIGSAISLFVMLYLAASSNGQVDPDNLKRGLVARHTDTYRTEIVRLEPTVALSLKAGESPHPRLSPEGSTTRWQGYINIVQAGSYRFRVHLRGRVRILLGAREILAAEVKEDKPAFKETEEVRLEAGAVQLTVEFTRFPGIGLIELLWESRHFRQEPLPFDLVGHLPEKLPARLKTDSLAEQGRYLVEEHACMRCHQPDANNKIAKGLQPRQGPDLSKVGERVHGEWIYRWLDGPRKMRPASVMPELFDSGEEGATERYAVTRYLVSLGGRIVEKGPKPQPAQLAESSKRGQQLFTSIGCIVCHGPVGATPAPERKDREEDPKTFLLHSPPALYPFKGMGGKTNPDQLAAFLRNPHATNPASRMPSMLLDPKEALDLAHFLCEASGPKDHKLPDAPPAAQREKAIGRFASDDKTREQLLRLPQENQWTELGKHIVEAKGCVSCHTITPQGKTFPAFSAKAKLNELTAQKGCLAEEDAKRGHAPRFALGKSERESIRAFLNEGLTGAGSPAPVYQAMTTLRRLNCLACHGRDGEGGLASGLVEQLRKFEKAENAESVVPPPLTGVGHKLRTPWLREVLTKAGRARPWMGLRMPQFGEANVGALPESLAALEGIEPNDVIHKVNLSGEKVGAGRFLVGKQAFGCISCHDIAGIPNHGTRGPDLATMNERVRFDWYERWLNNAQRIQPGTRMPTVFQDGKTQLMNTLKGSADAQAEAMWAYLSLGPTLPLPEGVELATKGLVLPVKEKTVIIRTFLPDAGSRAIAVGYPEGVSLAFDAAACRLAYVWTGNFLDVAGTWTGRGGTPAFPLGPKAWTAPAGCPWGTSDGPNPPDFAARALDPGFGGKLPEGKLHDGPHPLHFEGYSTDEQGKPTFRYRIELAKGVEFAVAEHPEPLRSQVAVGLRRQFALEAPVRQTAWLFAGEGDTKPRVFHDKGEPITLDFQGDAVEMPASRSVVLTQERKVQVLKLPVGPKGCQWRVQRAGSRWQVLLKVPSTADSAKQTVVVAIWIPHRDEPTLLREVLSPR
jgi:mono/diheme cytochrome c family protein